MTPPAVVASWSLERRAGRLERTLESARGRWARREGLTLRLVDRDGNVGLGEAAPLPSFSRESIDDCERALRAVAESFEELRAPVADALAGFAASLDLGLAFTPGGRPLGNGGAGPGERSQANDSYNPGVRPQGNAANPDRRPRGNDAAAQGRQPQASIASAPGNRPGGLPARDAAFARLASRLAPYPAARFAMETALLDLAARRDGVSVATFLAGDTVRTSVPRSGLLAGADDLDGARRMVAAGLRTLKVKVGVRPFEDERAGLKRLRKALPAEIALRLDAGGAWDVETARERLAALAEVAPELCEEPTDGAGMLALGKAAVPWAPDESLAIPGLPERLLASPGCGAVVLKPAFLGGLLPALALARRAAKQDVAVIVTHFFDGPIGLAAACELALAVPGAVLPCGLEPHPGLAAWPRIVLPQLRRPGLVMPSGLPGLGLERYGEA